MPRQQSIGEDAAGGKDPLTPPTRLQSVRDVMAEAAISSIDDAATDVSSVTLSVALGQRESTMSNNGKDDDAEQKPDHNMVAPPSPSNNYSRSQLQESFSSIQESLDRGRKGRNSRGKPWSSLLSSSYSDTAPGAVAVPGMGGSQEVGDSKRRSEGANDTSKQLSLAPPIEELSTEAMEAAPLGHPVPSTVVDITPAAIPPTTRGQTNASIADATEDNDSSLPIVAELVPDEDKLGNLVQRKVEERLEQELQNRLASERQSQVTVSAIPVDEEESSAPRKAVPAESEKRYIMGMSKSIFGSLVVVLLILLGAGVGVGFALSGGGRGEDDNNDGDNGGANPESGGNIETTVAPQTPEGVVPPNMPTEVIELFDLMGDDVSENKSTLLQEGTPQNQALTWLALEDGWKDEWDALPKEVAVERYSLAVLYFATGGENWLEQFSFLTSTSVCDWWNEAFGGGVICDGQGLHVTELYMPSAGLRGTIPTEIGLLSNLERLTMDDNSLLGSLPTELSRLTNILTLSLSSNILSGSLPTQLDNLTKMEVFAIFDNQIEGSIPSEIGLLTSIYALGLANNRLTGAIPPELGSLIFLEFLYLDGNELDGSLPIELAILSDLLVFAVVGNRLSGEIPSEFAISFMELEVFSIEQNDFHGSLDPAFCLDRSNFPIEDFVADCGGESPKIECSCCTDCCENGQCRPKHSLGYDILVGRIGDLVTDDLRVFEDTANPQYHAMAWLATEVSWDWTNTSETELLTDQFLIDRYALATLYFSTNGPNLWQAALPHPSSICDWYPNAESSIQCNMNQSVTHLELNEFGLQGVLSSELGLMTNLVSLRLSDNELDSTIPEEYYNLASLELFSIENSLLHGTLSPSIGELSKLTFFSVNTNGMYGTLPSEIGLLTDMTHFLPLRNQFVGTIPLEVQNLLQLEVLDLEGNRLTGALPSEIGLLTNLWALYLDTNNFVSTIPAEYANLRSLEIFSLPNNSNLFGTIPFVLGNMIQLIELRLHDNNLSGTIPTEFGRMRVLQSLFMDGNNLNGTLPTELGQLPELVELSLFDNFLTGTVPTELAALSSLELVQLQQNELIGNVDPIFCQESREIPIEVLLADCGDVSPEITCTCCTSC